MSLLAYYSNLVAVQDRPSLVGTLARWSVVDYLPDAQGVWAASEGTRVLEPAGSNFSLASTTLLSGAPAVQFTGADRWRLRGGLDLSAASSLAYILVFEAPTGNTQVLLEHSANYDQTLGRFICFLQGYILPLFHLSTGEYHYQQNDFAENTPYVLGYRLNPALAIEQGRALSLTRNSEFPSLSTRTTGPGPQFGTDALYVGGRGGSALPFVGKLSALHLFREEPDPYLFQQWLSYYAQRYL